MRCRRYLLFLILIIMAGLGWLMAAPISGALAGEIWREDWSVTNQKTPPNPPTDKWYMHTFNSSTDSYSFGVNTLTMHGNSWGIESKQAFNKNTPLSVKSKVKTAPVGPNAPDTQSFAGITIYNGESGYAEIALRDNLDANNLQVIALINDVPTVLPNSSQAFPDATYHTGGQNNNLPHDQFYDLRIEYDGRNTYQFYVNDVLLWTAAGREITSHPNIFLLSVAQNSCTYIGTCPGKPHGYYLVDSTFQEIQVVGNYNLFGGTTWVTLAQGNPPGPNPPDSSNVDTNGSPCSFGQCDYLQLAMSAFTGRYESSGYTRSPQITVKSGMDWGEVLTSTAPDGQLITIQVLDGACTPTPENNCLISDQYLPGNAAGFQGNSVNLSKLSPTQFPTLRLQANFYTWDGNRTPRLFDWALNFLPQESSHAYFTWYDQASPGMRNWLLTAYPNDYGGEAHFWSELGSPAIRTAYTSAARGQAAYTTWPGAMGGPVEVTKLSGLPGLVSQRILYGNSLEETVAVDENRLSSYYHWTWYDELSAGFKNWVLIANPSETETVRAEISFRDKGTGQTVFGVYDIGPGQNVTPDFPGRMGGPVEVKAYKPGASWETQPKDVIASQRVTTGYGTAFNEVNGIPHEELSNHYYWTWYDNASAGATNWVLVSNPNPNAVTVNITVGNNTYGPYSIAPGDNVTPTFPGSMGGPVEVASTGGDVIATQRSLWGSSFEEVRGTPEAVAGIPEAGLASTYNWTWYDNASAGASNWVVISNMENEPVIADVYIGGVLRGSYPLGSKGAMAAPKYNGLMGGLVEVRARNGKKVLASQRVLWSGFFNEVPGTVLPAAP